MEAISPAEFFPCVECIPETCDENPLTQPPTDYIGKFFSFYHNIGITDSFKFANVVASGYGIEQSVNVVQENHGLYVKRS